MTATEPRIVSPTGAKRTEYDRIIVSCGIGDHYAAGFREQGRRVTHYCPDAWQLFYDDYPAGCPTQEQSQYAFKIFALERAIREGFRYVLWMDAAFSPVASIEPLWKEIERAGWYVPPQGNEMLDRWCSDDALGIFNIDRAKAGIIPLVYSGLVGLDMQTASFIGTRVWREWERLYSWGTFDGCHVNLPGQPRQPWGQKWQGHVSHDPKVQGHRHDESALSYVLWSLGLVPKSLGFLTLESEAGFIGHHMERKALT